MSMLLYQIPREAQREHRRFSVVGFDPADSRRSAELAIEPGLRFHLPKGAKLLSSQLSGGRLDEWLSEEQARFGNRLWLLIEPVCHVLPLPCPDGQGEMISEKESLALQSCHICYDAPELCCKYCTFQTNEKYYVHLFDTEQSMKMKLDLAISLQIDNIIYIM